MITTSLPEQPADQDACHEGRLLHVGGVDLLSSCEGKTESAKAQSQETVVTSEWLNDFFDGIESCTTVTSDGDWLKDLMDAVELEVDSAVKDVAMELTPEPKSNSPSATSSSHSAQRAPLLSYSLNISEAEPKVSGTCRSCAQEIALVIYHGAEAEKMMASSNFVVDITCRACYEHQDPSLPTKYVIRTKKAPRKKRKAPDWSTQVWCEVCNHLVGYGGVRIDTGDSGWHETPVEVEIICATCIVDFNICRTCRVSSVGYNFRSGVWRPRPLFDGKTCLVAHGKLKGKLNPKFVTYHVPYLKSDGPTWDLSPTYHIYPLNCDPLAQYPNRVEALANSFLDKRRGMITDKFVHAQLMRSVPSWWNWDKVVMKLEKGVEERVRILFGHETMPTVPRHVRRYVTMGHHIGSDDIVEKVPKHKRRDGSKEILQSGAPPLVGYSFMEFYVDEGHVYIGDIMSQKNNDFTTLIGLTASTLTRIEQDCRLLSLPQPKHVWLFITMAIPPGSDIDDGAAVVAEMEQATNHKFLTVKNYAQKYCEDEAALRSLLTREYRGVPNDGSEVMMVMRWTNWKILEKERLFTY